MLNNSSLPVVIAGAGPAGSVLALYLAQREIPVVLLEKSATLPIDLRASTFHPPSLEMLDELGIARKMIDKGLVVERYQYRDKATGDIAEFNMQAIADETDFPFRLQLEQYELTYLIADELKAYSHVSTYFEHEVKGFEQNQNGVSVKVETPDGQKYIEGCFLLGCDGASSNVRKAAGIEYSGFTYEEKFLVASTDFAFEDVFENLSYVNYVSDPDDWCVMLRTDKLWRVLWPTDPEEKNPEGKYLDPDFIQDKLQQLYPKSSEYKVSHTTLYNVHQRVAENYYADRVVLVGDAAHINNPLGGMGMNGGLHDAFNLARKLVDVMAGNITYQDAFAHYQRQRKGLAVKFVQKHTIENKKLMEATDVDTQQKRQKMFMETAADPEKAKAFIMERAMFTSLRESEAVN